MHKQHHYMEPKADNKIIYMIINHKQVVTQCHNMAIL